ncbi:MAG: hypothetical protein DRI22_05105 [Caldiserica bacterium]|nr:MAG: hypothetical protein DRI22_05105 [Caldisericota bacterium]
MLIQIYAINNLHDAEKLCELGVDRLGIVTSKNGNVEKGIVSYMKAKELISSIREQGRETSLILDVKEIEEIVPAIELIKPDYLHICYEVEREYLIKLRESVKSKILLAIPVSGEESIEKAILFDDLVDSFILDTPGESKQMPGFIGATGKTHDWNISRKIVESVKKPVILGGGLSPENVCKAIKRVKPSGVDAKTSLDIPEGNGRKDIKKVELFVKRVRECKF